MQYYKCNLLFFEKMATQIKVGEMLKALIRQAWTNVSAVAPKTGYSREHLSLLLNRNRLTPELVVRIGAIIQTDVSEVLAVMGSDIIPPPLPPAPCQAVIDENAALRQSLDEAYHTINNLSKVIENLTK